MHNYQDLITLFNACFEESFNTRLIAGGDEPMYLPAHEHQSYHAIIFTHDYFRSALHECAHWFIAGDKRRQQIDYGYWYEPDGRSVEQQTRFQEAEIKPQALEYILSQAAKHPFCISLDNLNQTNSDNSSFAEAVQLQASLYLQQGLPVRAEQFKQALINFYI
jgi:elongation factor P hydroxylase